MKILSKFNLIIALFIVLAITNCSQQDEATSSLSFTVRPDTSSKVFQVELECNGILRDNLDLKLPVWTPGYYQIMDYAENIIDFKVTDMEGNNVDWDKLNKNSWRIHSDYRETIHVNYTVKTSRGFVATSFMNYDRAYITPASVFMHVDGMIQHPVTITLHLKEGLIATGLDYYNGTINQFRAANFDILYDSPILMGRLEELPDFEVRSIPHRFVGYQLGDFDRDLFISDLKKIVEAGVDIFNDIPYEGYTFLAIGPGRGGLEHLNSTAFSFNGNRLNSPEGKRSLYTFLAHEYFHHYNIKRIRPIELGPFDYNRENRTNMLWVSEGITVYYDLLLVKRAGLMTVEELLEEIQGRLRAYETKPGRLYQTVQEASYNTWSDGPFGGSGEDINKTISVYDKGSILGLLLDFNIRHKTQNKQSLDDVMRTLYQEFYLEKERGFTEDEFKEVSEGIAGEPLEEFFEYTSTVKPIDYKKHFGYAGLDIDSEPQQVPGGWLGLITRRRADSLYVTEVEYESPAWNSGIRRGMIILDLSIENEKEVSIQALLSTRRSGERVVVKAFSDGSERNFEFSLGEKIEPTYNITIKDQLNDLQEIILKDWADSRME